MDQSGEHLLFGIEGDGTIVAHVEHFAGPYRAVGGGCHVAGRRSAGSWTLLLALLGLALLGRMRR